MNTKNTSLIGLISDKHNDLAGPRRHDPEQRRRRCPARQGGCSRLLSRRSPSTLHLTMTPALKAPTFGALLLAFGSANTWYRGFHPTRFVPCPAHTVELSGCALFARSMLERLVMCHLPLAYQLCQTSSVPAMPLPGQGVKARHSRTKIIRRSVTVGRTGEL
jgi:hypothetical protein